MPLPVSPGVDDPAQSSSLSPNQGNQLQNLSEAEKAAAFWGSLRGEESLQVLKGKVHFPAVLLSKLGQP